MSETLPTVLTDMPLGLNKTFFESYQSFDEKQDLYAEIKKASAATSWMQADFFKYLWEEMGEKTLNKFASTINEPVGTINNYIRTAIGFPNSQRNPMSSFSHHFQATWSDSYDSKTKKFSGNNRFQWLDKSIQEGWSTRKLAEEISRNKHLKELGTRTAPCVKCKETNGTVIPYNFFNTQTKHSDHFDFHELCYQQVITFQ